MLGALNTDRWKFTWQTQERKLYCFRNGSDCAWSGPRSPGLLMLVSVSIVIIIGSPYHQTWNPLHIITVQTVPGFNAVKSYAIGSQHDWTGNPLTHNSSSDFIWSQKRVINKCVCFQLWESWCHPSWCCSLSRLGFLWTAWGMKTFWSPVIQPSSTRGCFLITVTLRTEETQYTQRTIDISRLRTQPVLNAENVRSLQSTEIKYCGDN